MFGVGGRQARTAPEYGHIFDHFGLDYEYANGVRMQSMCRQIPGTPGLVAEAFVGTKGTMDTQDGRRYEINGPERVEVVGRVHESVPAGAHGPDREHPGGKPFNELKQVADSTLTAICGRESAYTGKVVAFDQYVATAESLAPSKLDFGPAPTPPVAVPGTGTGTM